MNALQEDPAPSKGSLAFRALRTLAVFGLSAGTFAVSLAAGVVLHLDLPPMRRAVRSTVNDLFADLFVGEVRLGPIEHLTTQSLSVAQFTAKRPDGHLVIDAEGVRLRGDWLRPVAELVWRGGSGRLGLGHLRIERGFVGLDIVPDEPLAIAEVFASKEPSAPTPRAERAAFMLDLATVELGEVRVAGTLAPAVPMDATVNGLLARVAVGTEGIAIDVDRSSIRETRLVGAPVQGTSDFHLHGRFEGEERVVDMWGSFGGHLGELEVQARTQIRQGEVQVTLDLPRVGPNELSHWLPEAPLTRDLSARLVLHGRPPTLSVTGGVEIPPVQGAPPGRLAVEGVIDARDRVVVDAVVEVDDFDAKLLSLDLPHTQLSFRAAASTQLAGPDTAVSVALEGRPSRWGEIPIPVARGVVAASRAGVEARLAVDEAGAASDLFARYDAEAGLVFAMRSRAPSLARIPRLEPAFASLGVDGRVHANVEGKLGADGALDLHATADAAALRIPASEVAVGGARVEARLSGPTGEPAAMRLDARVVGSDAAIGERKLPEVRIDAVGPLLRPTVQADVVDALRREVTAKAVIDAQRRELADVQVGLVDGSVKLDGRVEQIRSFDDLLTIDGLRLEGLGGEIAGGLRVERGELIGKLRGSKLDLDRLSRLLGLKFPVRGEASIDLDLARDGDGRRGHVQLQVSGGGVLIVGGLDLSLDTRLEGDRVVTEAALVVDNPLGHDDDHPCAKPIGTLTLEDAETALRGPLLSSEAWAGADLVGTLGLESADLACLAEVWQEASPTAAIPVTEVAGVLDATLGLVLEAGSRFPSIIPFGAKTTGLVVAGRPVEGAEAPPWKSDALDLAVAGSFDGGSGEATLSVALLDDDRKAAANLARAPLVRLAAKAEALDLDALAAGGERALDALAAAQMSASVETARGPLSRWTAIPAPFREAIPALEGDIEVDAYLEGTLADPSLALRARAWGLHRERKNRRRQHANDLDVLVSYQGKVGRLDGTLRRDGKRVALLSGESQGDLAVRVLGRGADDRWTGWASARLTDLDLGSLPPLADRQISGTVNGTVSLRGLGEEPRVIASLDIPVLALGKARFANARVAIEPINEGRAVSLQASLPAVRDGRPDGALRVVGYGSLEWERLLIPKPALDRAAGLYVVAENFPLDGAETFAGDGFARVGGRLNGELRLGHLEKVTQPISLDMDMALTQGLVQLAGLGQEVHGITAKLTSRGGLLEVDDIELRSGTGRATGSLRAGLDGLGLNVVTGTLVIDEEEPFPIARDGVSLGTVSGRIDTNVSMRDEMVETLLVTQGLRFRLPPSSNRNVQALDAHPDVVVLQPVGAPQEDEAAEEATPTPVRVVVVLSPTVIEGNQLRIALLTESPIAIEPDGTVSGEIVVTGGELTLLDKTFRIDRGTVLLREEEPGNPYLNVTALWDAPDGSTVFVDYVGPIKPMSKDNFTFRSNPPRPEGEVLALLIFGDASAGATAQDQSNTVANSVAAAQFNALVGQLAPGVTTKVSTSSASVSYQISESLTLSASIENLQDQGAKGGETETSASGGDPDNVGGSGGELSVGWRFAERWLVRGTVGVGVGANSGVDLLFQHRY